MPTSLDRIHNRIAQAAPAGVWSRADFLDIGTPNAVEKALQRLTLRGDIRRPYRGLYDKPSISKLTGKVVFPPRASFIDAIARRDKLRVLVDGMTAANDLGLTTAVPARSTIHADTYPRTIEIKASAGDPKATTPVIYKLEFKRISAKTAFWAGRPAMRVVQALAWFRDDRSSLEAAVNGIVRYLSRNPDCERIAGDLRENIQAIPAWMYPLAETIGRRMAEELRMSENSWPARLRDDASPGATMDADVRTARCACGQLWIKCEGTPEKVSACHCLECQRRTGSAFGVAVFYNRDRTMTSGASSIFERGSDSGYSIEHHFCPACGTTVFWYPARKPAHVAVAGGCFGGDFPMPTQQVYVHHRKDWLDLSI